MIMYGGNYSMKLDSKQKVLLAIYTEYQKDIPEMKNYITPEDLGIDNPLAFRIALEKLQSEQLICGAKFVYGDGYYIPVDVLVDYIKMTRDGIDYVENKIGIDKTLSGFDKVKYIVQKSAEIGWDQVKDIAARTMAEIAKGQ